MKNMTLKNLAAAAGGILKNDKGNESEASCVVIDSRKISEGGIFIATKGERADGHTFIADVAGKGALGVVCEKEPEGCDIPYILVRDSFQALKDIAAYYRQQFTAKVIGITGSVGKTSTKEMIAQVLSGKFKVCKTQGNFNNEVGMPLTILSVRDEDEVAVVEMGISDFGEMSRLTAIAKPDMCVITNIGTVHLEKLTDRDGVLRAKTEIYEGMPEDGIVFLNGDDDKLRGSVVPKGMKTVFYGFSQDNDFFVTGIKSKGFLGTDAVIHLSNGRILHVNIPLPGQHMIMNALAASAVGHVFGLTDDEIINGIASAQSTDGRSKVIRTKRFTLIDDSYNANPVSMKAALDLLSQSAKRKVAILGDMFELGENEKELHRDVAEYAAGRADVLVTVGSLWDEKHTDFISTAEAAEHLPDILKDDDVVLVKASHGMHFDELAETIRKLGNGEI